MKLLLDQNISFRLVEKLDQKFLGSQQVKKLGLENTTDRAIWDYARKEGFVLVTFDSDFYDLSVTYGHPPKLIWIKTRNQTTTHLAILLQEKIDQIVRFEQDGDLSCLEIIG